MLYRLHKPGPPLSRFVKVLWTYRGRPQTHTRERLLPDGSVELVVNLFENQNRVYDADDPKNKFQAYGGSVVCGPHSKFFIIDTQEEENVVGVHFKPGGSVPFLGIPADELHNLHISLEDIWGAEAVNLRDQLLEAPSEEVKLRVLESALLRAGARRMERHAAVEFAIAQFQGPTYGPLVSQITDQIGLSQKRFIDIFRGEVGLTPKVFFRLQRFQHAIRSTAANERVIWSNIALDCGYFDQAHFIHDFRAFSGISPTAYLEQRTPHLNHVPLVD